MLLLLLDAWKMPINISQESYERVTRSASPVLMPKTKKLKVEDKPKDEEKMEVDEVKDEKPDIKSETVTTNGQYKILFSMANETANLEKMVKYVSVLNSTDSLLIDNFAGNWAAASHTRRPTARTWSCPNWLAVRSWCVACVGKMCPSCPRSGWRTRTRRTASYRRTATGSRWAGSTRRSTWTWDARWRPRGGRASSCCRASASGCRPAFVPTNARWRSWLRLQVTSFFTGFWGLSNI